MAGVLILGAVRTFNDRQQTIGNDWRTDRTLMALPTCTVAEERTKMW